MQPPYVFWLYARSGMLRKKGEDKMKKRRMNGIKRILTVVFICLVLVNEPAGRKVYAVEGTPQETVAVSNKQEFYEAIGTVSYTHLTLPTILRV